MLDVVGIGNAIVDVLVHADDGVLERLAMAKGSMVLIDEARAESLYAAIEPALQRSGGSAANTMAGIASLDGRATSRKLSAAQAASSPQSSSGSTSPRSGASSAASMHRSIAPRTEAPLRKANCNSPLRVTSIASAHPVISVQFGFADRLVLE